MRCGLNDLKIETLVDTGGDDSRPGSDALKWCIGIAVDPVRRANFTGRKKDQTTGEKAESSGQTSKFRRASDSCDPCTDIEPLFDTLPELADLELDAKNRILYWTDRGDAPLGNTVNRATMGSDSGKRPLLARDPDFEFDGRDRDRSRFQGEPDVHHRFGRIDLFRAARRIGQETVARRAGESDRNCIRANRHKGKTDMSYGKPIRRIAVVGYSVSSAPVGPRNIWPAGSMSSPRIPRRAPKRICANLLTRRGGTSLASASRRAHPGTA